MTSPNIFFFDSLRIITEFQCILLRLEVFATCSFCFRFILVLFCFKCENNKKTVFIIEAKKYFASNSLHFTLNNKRWHFFFFIPVRSIFVLLHIYTFCIIVKQMHQFYFISLLSENDGTPYSGVRCKVNK